MNITYCKDYQSMSLQAGLTLITEIEKKKDLLLCASTGNSPTGLYKELEIKSLEEKEFFQYLRIIKLDEWGGVPPDHPSTCEQYLRKKLVIPLDISPVNYISFLSDPPDPSGECMRIQSELDRQGPIDVCILGLGRNGHLGLNEPGEPFDSQCHVAKLTEISLGHSMLGEMDSHPAYGLTLGLKDILSSALILLLVSGKNKTPVLGEFLQEKANEALPASCLWSHQNVECFINQSDVD